MQPLPTPVRVPLDLKHGHEHEHEGGGVRGEEQDQKILDQEKHNQEVVSMDRKRVEAESLVSIYIQPTTDKLACLV